MAENSPFQPQDHGMNKVGRKHGEVVWSNIPPLVLY